MQETVLQHLPAFLKLVKVTLHDLRAAGAYLAYFTNRHGLIRIVNVRYLYLRGRKRHTDGTRLVHPEQRVGGNYGGRFAQAVSFHQPAAGAALKILLHFLRQRPAARDAHLKRGKIVLINALIIIQCRKHRRHSRHQRRTLEMDVVQDGLDVELGMENNRGAGMNGKVHDRRHRKHMEQRQRCDDGFLAALEAGKPHAALQSIDIEIGMGQHCGLGHSGSPAGILQHGHVAVRMDGDRLQLIACLKQIVKQHVFVIQRKRGDVFLARELECHALGERQLLLKFADDDFPEFRLAEALRHFRVERMQRQGEHDLGGGIVNLVAEVLGGIKRVIVYHRAARHQYGVIAHDELRAVGHEYADINATSDPEPLQPRRQLPDIIRKLSKARLTSHEIQGDMVRIGILRLIQQGKQGMRRDRYVPWDILRVGFKPRIVHTVLLITEN